MEQKKFVVFLRERKQGAGQGESSVGFKYDGNSYTIWNGSWAAVDKNITNFVTKFHDANGKPDHPETTPHNPWPN
jgi:hypothetical protein